MLIEEQQGGQSLVLRTRRDPPLDRQRRQERLDFGHPHLGRMSLAMKEDVATDPADIRLLGPYRVVKQPEPLPDPVEQLRRS